LTGLSQPFRSLAIAWLVAVAWAGAAAAQQLESLTIATKAGDRHVFQVEVARTPDLRSQGLMYRKSMPGDRGMLFDFERVEPVSMWMKNTYISLDMIFVRGNGTISRIETGTEPFSESVISSGGKALAVIEMKAGSARRLGLKAGDKVSYPAFH
jgi:uncharacterized protein